MTWTHRLREQVDFAAKHGYLHINWMMIQLLFRTAVSPTVDQDVSIKFVECVRWKAVVISVIQTPGCCVERHIVPYDRGVREFNVHRTQTWFAYSEANHQRNPRDTHGAAIVRR